MSKTIHLIQTKTSMGAINRWQIERKMTPVALQQDLALHKLLTESFGELAPYPFRLMPDGTLYGYAKAPAEELQQAARQFANPSQFAALEVESMLSKPMPETWDRQMALDFEVKVIPTIRTRGEDGRRVELSIQRHPLYDRNRDPEEAHRDWLIRRLDRFGCAQIEDCQIQLLRGHSTMRGQGKGLTRMNLPVAVIHGTLRVTDDQHFNEMLAHGIGSHRAYGYGLMLMKPSSVRHSGS